MPNRRMAKVKHEDAYLWSVYLADRTNLEIRDRLIEFNLDMVDAIISRSGYEKYPEVSEEDLRQEGIVALICSVQTYDPESPANVSFHAFAYDNIFRAIYTEMAFHRRKFWLSRREEHAYRLLGLARMLYTSTFKAEPSEIELATFLGYPSVEELRAINFDYCPIRLVSLSVPIRYETRWDRSAVYGDDDWKTRDLYHTLASTYPEWFPNIFNLPEFDKCIAGFSESDVSLMHLLLEERSLHEIASQLETSVYSVVVAIKSIRSRLEPYKIQLVWGWYQSPSSQRLNQTDLIQFDQRVRQKVSELFGEDAKGIFFGVKGVSRNRSAPLLMQEEEESFS